MIASEDLSWTISLLEEAIASKDWGKVSKVVRNTKILRALMEAEAND